MQWSSSSPFSCALQSFLRLLLELLRGHLRLNRLGPPARFPTRAQAKMETPAGNTVHNLLVAVVLFGVTAMTLGIAGSFTNLGTRA